MNYQDVYTGGRGQCRGVSYSVLGSRYIPVDSEYSAVNIQCSGVRYNTVELNSKAEADTV